MICERPLMTVGDDDSGSLGEVKLQQLNCSRSPYAGAACCYGTRGVLSTAFTESLTCPTHTHTHTHTRLTAVYRGLPGWAGTRKVKPIWILLKQETVSGSGISWATCKSAPRSRQITTPAPHHSVFLQAGCPSCRPTNSVKALK